MRLIIGGQGQGKLSYVLQEGHTKEDIIFCGEDGEVRIPSPPKKIIYNFHHEIRKLMQAGLDPMRYTEEHITDEMIVICNEIGAGIVPADRFERQYRDMVGLVCCALAKRAETVERVCCGISQTIKG